MKLNRTKILLTFAAAFAFTGWACSSHDSASTGDGGTGAESSANGPSMGSNGASSQSYVCCINSAKYACPNQQAFQQCQGFDLAACMAACEFDDFGCRDTCFAQNDESSPDPSSCNPDSSVTCPGGASSGSGQSSGSGSSGTCVGDWDGTNCDGDFDCASSNCTNNKCYGSANGNPCDGDADCSSSNCYAGCCHGNAAGDPCDGDADCSSSNCYQNVCQ